MERDNTVTETRVPLMPPQATLKAFTLHFSVALITLLVFGYTAYLLCRWLQPFNLRLWHLDHWGFRSDPIVHTSTEKFLFLGLMHVMNWPIEIGAFIVVSAWIGWLRRRLLIVQIRHLRLPCLVLIAIVVLSIPCTLWLMKLDGSTPLSFAARQGFKERARFLLLLGADPYSKGFSPFYCALSWSHMDIALMFVEVSPPTQPMASELLMLVARATNNPHFEKDGVTHYLPVSPEFKRLVERLMAAGADPNDMLEGDDRRPLQVAANSCKAEAVRILLECGAIIDASDSKGRTALHEAAVVCNNDTIQILLESGANPNPKENQGLTPLDLALATGKSSPGIYDITETVRILKSHGAITGNATGTNNNTP